MTRQGWNDPAITYETKEENDMQIRPMTIQDRSIVLTMVREFYQSDAVEHPVPDTIMERTFSDAIEENPYLSGYLMESDGHVVGFAYLTFFYACEVAGYVIMIEELFVREAYRGQGLGQQFLDWLYQAYPAAARFRLEIHQGNPAVRLYERNGFQWIDYGQMAYDV